MTTRAAAVGPLQPLTGDFGDGSGGAPAPTNDMPMAQALDPLVAPSAGLTFDQVYQAHVGFVWRVLRTLGVVEPQLEDAVQDVFVVVHRRLGEFAGRSRIETWLFAIARRVAAAHRRSLGRRDRQRPIDEQPALAASDDTFAALSRAEAARTVAGILDTMDPDKRTVFALVEIEQLSVPVVAEILNLNLNTAYSRLRLARRAFEAAVARRVEEP